MTDVDWKKNTMGLDTGACHNDNEHDYGDNDDDDWIPPETASNCETINGSSDDFHVLHHDNVHKVDTTAVTALALNCGDNNNRTSLAIHNALDTAACTADDERNLILKCGAVSTDSVMIDILPGCSRTQVKLTSLCFTVLDYRSVAFQNRSGTICCKSCSLAQDTRAILYLWCCKTDNESYCERLPSITISWWSYYSTSRW